MVSHFILKPKLLLLLLMKMLSFKRWPCSFLILYRFKGFTLFHGLFIVLKLSGYLLWKVRRRVQHFSSRLWVEVYLHVLYILHLWNLSFIDRQRWCHWIILLVQALVMLNQVIIIIIIIVCLKSLRLVAHRLLRQIHLIHKAYSCGIWTSILWRGLNSMIRNSLVLICIFLFVFWTIVSSLIRYRVNVVIVLKSSWCTFGGHIVLRSVYEFILEISFC